jgi:hypothetical protein
MNFVFLTDMKRLFFLSFLLCSFFSISQEYDSDLIQDWSGNTMSAFLKSDFKKMNVVTTRVVNGTEVVEYEAQYKVSKFTENRVNFTIKYSQDYVLADRKKSNGNYVINSNDNKVVHYERTDYNSKSVMVGTEFHDFTYQKGLVLFDKTRYKAYTIIGSVDIDSTVTHDSLSYLIRSKNDTIYQYNNLEENTFSYFLVKDNFILNSAIHVNGYEEVSEYKYNDKNQLVYVVTNLNSDSGDTIKNVLKIYYNSKGLINKTEYYDRNNTLVEAKHFSYN